MSFQAYRLCVLGAFLLLFLVGWLRAEDGAPESVSEADFRQLRENSPFTRSLLLSKTLVLSGIAEVDGSPVAICIDSDVGHSMMISDRPNEMGWTLIEIRRIEDLKSAVAIIAAKNGQTIQATYDTQLIKRSKQKFRFANARRAQQFATAQGEPSILPDWINDVGDPAMKGFLMQSFIERGGFDGALFQAVDMALAVPEQKARGPAISAAFGRLGGGVNGIKIDDAVNRLNSIPPSLDKDFAINGLAHGLVGRDPEGALRWANSISNEGFRKVVVQNVSRRIEARSRD